MSLRIVPNSSVQSSMDGSESSGDHVIRVEDNTPVFTIEDLETGLRMLGAADLDNNAFWDANIASFRQTVLFAIRETSDALLSPRITSAWRGELESQLEA